MMTNAIFCTCALQVASLAIASANGLLMKGGKEATHTNNLLMSIVKEGLGAYGCADSISLVSTREDIADLLKMDQVRFLTWSGSIHKIMSATFLGYVVIYVWGPFTNDAS